jgi:hypothetical protein
VAVDLDPTDHFVFRLDQIPRIEKLVQSQQNPGRDPPASVS